MLTDTNVRSAQLVINEPSGTPLRKWEDVERTVSLAAKELPVTDMHTHLFSADFKEQLLWGVDELLIYHYLTAEYFRYSELSYDDFWKYSKQQQAELIWQELFVKRSPVSEAASGVLTAFRRLGLDTSSRDINIYREAWKNRTASEQIDKVLAAARVKEVVMTNDPLDRSEREVWLHQGNTDTRFLGALRIDALLLNWTVASAELAAMGYQVEGEWNDGVSGEVRRFLKEWSAKVGALYIAASLPGDVRFGGRDHLTAMLEEAVIPVCLELGLPLGLMIGVRRQVNPSLKLAGDMSMKADLQLLEAVAVSHPDLQLLITVLARENQHELTVLSRKFRNITLFGCWWFLHTESMIQELTRFRTELLGFSYIPQHSDCRVLEQLINKWEHSRTVISEVLVSKYKRVYESGWLLSEEDIVRDLNEWFGGRFAVVRQNAAKTKVR
ncbi:glucuronate isomerase [Paenibacillus gansuensis]|uniref:Glucuronate isomerase n=1 Tax=Paenibacillus gansuensis TaxID=306542 RepID=A0ABW5PEJ2_9BACL